MALLTVLLACQGDEPAHSAHSVGPPAPRPAQAYSVQLHTHGSFSEGSGSLRSQTEEARVAGVDAVWWSDHDWRVAAYRHVSRSGFERPYEALDAQEPWRAVHPTERQGTKRWLMAELLDMDWVEARLRRDEVFAGGSSLRLAGSASTDTFGRLAYQFSSSRSRDKRPLATDVELALAVFPEWIGPDARVAVEVMLSFQPPMDELPDGAVLSLRYVLSDAPAPPVRVGGRYESVVVVEPGIWNEIVLPVSRDARAGFPFLDGDDNSMAAVQIVVEAREGATVAATFDAYAIRHRLQGPEALARQAELLDAMRSRIPEVAQLQGIEISYETPHLNEYGPAVALHDYDALTALSGFADESGQIADLLGYQRWVVEHAVGVAHARGSVVSLNHVFGPTEATGYTGTRSEMFQRLWDARAYGADLLEVGYRDRAGWSLDDYLWVWDELGRQGLPLVGTGVADTHGGPWGHWLEGPNNLVSWVWADSLSAADLLAGLKRGQVYFGDITRFGGTLDLRTPEGFAMGQVVLTDRDEHDVHLVADGLGAADRVRVLVGGRERVSLASETRAVEHVERVAVPAGGTFLRAEVHSDKAGEPIAFGNPIHFVRELPPEGVRAERAALDLAGVRCARFDGFRLTRGSVAGSGSELALELGGVGTDGSFALDVGGRIVDAVALDGLIGTWDLTDGLLSFEELQGTGSIRVAWSPR